MLTIEMFSTTGFFTSLRTFLHADQLAQVQGLELSMAEQALMLSSWLYT
jgi:hypothetical protein